MNPADLLCGQIEGALPDVLQAMIEMFAQAVMSARRTRCAGLATGSAAKSGELPQRLPAPGVGHPRRIDPPGGPEAGPGHVLCDAAAASASRIPQLPIRSQRASVSQLTELTADAPSDSWDRA